MARIINAGNKTVFEMSKASAFRMLFVCLAILGIFYWGFGEKMQTGTWDHSDLRNYFAIFITLIMFILGTIMIITLLTGKGTTLVMDRDKLTYTYCFINYSWSWKYLEDLYLGIPPQLEPQPLITVLGNKLQRQVIAGGKPDLRFKNHAPLKSGKRRYLFTSLIDGYTSVPLAFFSNPEDILVVAQSYNKSVLKKF